MKVILSVIRGPHEGKTFEFSGHDTFVVGRASYAHFRLPAKDPYFSRAHFMLEVNPPLCHLIDLSSSNGTYVNGKRVSEIELNNSDKIRGGDTVLQIQILTGNEPEAKAEQPHRVTVRESPPESPNPHRKTQRELPDQLFKAGKHHPVRKTPIDAVKAQGTLKQIGQYRIVRELGKGGMGTVYLGHSIKNDQPFAIKTVLPACAASKKVVQHFLRETSILRKLVHPSIVRFHDSGEENGRAYFAMEYVEGHDLQKILQRRGPMELKLAVEIVSQCLVALDYAHVKGFVHRDIKPANLMVSKSQRGVSVKLTDFGLARMYQASQLSGLTMHGDMGGSFGFMAPEQITNYRNTTPHADQYSAAAMLYYLITGKLIYDFPDKLADRVLMILQKEHVPLQQRCKGIPKALTAAIHKALSRKPANRFADALQFREALNSSS